MNELTREQREDMASRLEDQIEELWTVFAENLTPEDASEFRDYIEGLMEKRKC